jgi:hypothetical protein
MLRMQELFRVVQLITILGISRPVQQAVKNHQCDASRVEAGSNTSTVVLRVVGGDEKGSLESETVKYGLESHGTRTENDCAGEGQQKL